MFRLSVVQVGGRSEAQVSVIQESGIYVLKRALRGLRRVQSRRCGAASDLILFVNFSSA